MVLQTSRLQTDHAMNELRTIAYTIFASFFFLTKWAIAFPSIFIISYFCVFIFEKAQSFSCKFYCISAKQQQKSNRIKWDVHILETNIHHKDIYTSTTRSEYIHSKTDNQFNETATHNVIYTLLYANLTKQCTHTHTQSDTHTVTHNALYEIE